MTQRTDSPRTFTEAIGKVHRRTGGGEAVIFFKNNKRKCPYFEGKLESIN